MGSNKKKTPAAKAPIAKAPVAKAAEVAVKGGKRPRSDDQEEKVDASVSEPPRVVGGRVVVSLSSAYSSRKPPAKPQPTPRVDGIDEATIIQFTEDPKVRKAMSKYSAHAHQGRVALAKASTTQAKAHAANSTSFAWTTSTGKAGTSIRVRADRFNFPGCEKVNELVLKNMAGPKLVAGQQTRSEHRVITPLTARKRKDVDTMISVKVPKTVLIDRAPWNLVKAFVHPLHNHLQQQNGLNNEDEIQVLLLPNSEEYGASGKQRRQQQSGGGSFRNAFIATNQETLTQESLDKVTAGWGVLDTLRISSVSVIHGEKGRHAEQKLIDFYMSTFKKKDWATFERNNKKIAAMEEQGDAALEDQHFPYITFEGVSSGTDSPLLIGERLPCVSCRLYAAVTGLDKHVAVLPTHGHLYLSTFEHTPSCVTSLTPHAALEVLNGGI